MLRSRPVGRRHHRGRGSDGGRIASDLGFNPTHMLLNLRRGNIVRDVCNLLPEEIELVVFARGVSNGPGWRSDHALGFARGAATAPWENFSKQCDSSEQYSEPDATRHSRPGFLPISKVPRPRRLEQALCLLCPFNPITLDQRGNHWRTSTSSLVAARFHPEHPFLMRWRQARLATRLWLSQ